MAIRRKESPPRKRSRRPSSSVVDEEEVQRERRRSSGRFGLASRGGNERGSGRRGEEAEEEVRKSSKRSKRLHKRKEDGDDEEEEEDEEAEQLMKKLKNQWERKEQRQPTTTKTRIKSSSGSKSKITPSPAGKSKLRSSPARKKPDRRQSFSMFASLDALLEHDDQVQKKKLQQQEKLDKLREEAKDMSQSQESEAGMLMQHVESNISSLKAEEKLFATKEPEGQERFGYVFTSMDVPLEYDPFVATDEELDGNMRLVYRAMETTDDKELGALLWSRVLIMRFLFSNHRKLSTPIDFADRVVQWLFTTLSTHHDPHVIKGAFGNLYLLFASSHPEPSSVLIGLPGAFACDFVDELHNSFGIKLKRLNVAWKPNVEDFLTAFRRFGFKDSKRSMSTKNKISARKPRRRSQSNLFAGFPSCNMRHVLYFMVICLRTKKLQIDAYDAFGFTMFFLRMQFEKEIHPEIVSLVSICIEELLEVFGQVQWRKEWAPTLVMRIAGAKEGLFLSLTGWLTIARRLPTTFRGVQLAAGLALFVLQHRLTDEPVENARPPKFPISSGAVIAIIDQVLAEPSSVPAAAQASPEILEKICFRVSFLDIALSGFVRDLETKRLEQVLQRLDVIARKNRSTMCAKWHELKTIVSLMGRKYAIEGLGSLKELGSEEESDTEP